MKTSKTSITLLAGLTALSLTAAACADGTDTAGDDPTVTTSITDGTLTDDTTTNPSLTEDSAPAETDTDMAAELDALGARVEALASQTVELDNAEVEEGFEDFRDSFEQFRDQAEEGVAALDADVITEVQTDLSTVASLVTDNSAELGAEFETEWNDFMAQFEAFLSMSS